MARHNEVRRGAASCASLVWAGAATLTTRGDRGASIHRVDTSQEAWRRAAAGCAACATIDGGFAPIRGVGGGA